MKRAYHACNLHFMLEEIVLNLSLKVGLKEIHYYFNKRKGADGNHCMYNDYGKDIVQTRQHNVEAGLENCTVLESKRKITQ